MATEPVLRGEWLRPGQHLDLIGAYRADMREADDAALRRARIFVDSFETTLDHIGELKDPLARGVIARADVLGDLHDLVAGRVGRRVARRDHPLQERRRGAPRPADRARDPRGLEGGPGRLIPAAESPDSRWDSRRVANVIP